ncbi:MAG: DUF3108 domain-containing protein [Candidatus Omnitrophica bacterium]|nr:DUF3108 domain-containing protein [Candidatus Omnitrophota bacterium]MDD5652648.1 DUF3108 domain-containing protein [Candidatus Omnitrophota bacterium]
MKKIWLIIAILLVLIVIARYRDNNDPALIISGLLCNGEIRGNAALDYRINLFSVFPAGEAEFRDKKEEIFENKKVYHLSADAGTGKFVSRFFKARVVLDSYVDPQSNNPLFFSQKVFVPGKPDINKEIRYDQKQKIMLISGSSREILADTQDPLSAMFNIRTMDFSKIKEFEMNINTNQKNYLLSARVCPKEITVAGKKYQLFIIDGEIKRRNKNPYHKTKLKITLLKQKENIPLSVKVFSSGMLINAKLVEVR